MTGLNLDGFLSFIAVYQERLQELKDTLNTLDNRIGDGDHGTNMARGFEAAHQQLTIKSPGDLSGAAMTVAMALLSNVGGASGPLYGTVFMKLSGIFGHRTEVDEEVLTEALAAARTGIAERGKATVGDKTMLDVWDKSVSYLEENPGEHRFVQMVEIVRDEVLETRNRIAKKGRAAYLGPRSQGTCDPGSVSSGLFFEELARAIGEGRDQISWETLVL